MKSCYVLGAHPRFVRVMRPSDLINLGLKPASPEDLVWNQENGHVLVLDDETSDSLASNFPDEFLSLPLLGDESGDASISSGSSEGSVSESEVDETAADDESTPAGNPVE